MAADDAALKHCRYRSLSSNADYPSFSAAGYGTAHQRNRSPRRSLVIRAGGILPAVLEFGRDRAEELAGAVIRRFSQHASRGDCGLAMAPRRFRRRPRDRAGRRPAIWRLASQPILPGLRLHEERESVRPAAAPQGSAPRQRPGRRSRDVEAHRRILCRADVTSAKVDRHRSPERSRSISAPAQRRGSGARARSRPFGWQP